MLKTKVLTLVLSITIAVAYVLFLLLPINTGYEYFTEYAANFINKTNRLPAIRNAFPESNFPSIKWAVYIGGAITFSILVLANIYSAFIYKNVRTFLCRIKQSILSLIKVFSEVDFTSKSIFTLTLAYLIIQSLWYMYHLPFIHDEAYTITNFVIPGPVAAMTFYPYPNNHILFSLYSYPFSFLPLKPEVAFRLPSLIAVVITCIILFRLFQKVLPAKIAALALVMFVSMLPVMVYAIFARGYCLVFLFSCLSIYSLIRVIEARAKYHQLLLVIFSVAGLYTIPSYIYPFAAIFTVYVSYGIWIRKWTMIKTAIISGLFCGVITLLLYLPVIITSGGWAGFLKVLYFGYDYTPSISHVKSFLTSVYSLQFFENNILAVAFIILTMIAAAFSIRKFKTHKSSLTDKLIFWIALIGFLAPLISFLLQKKLVAPRTHSYAALFFTCFAFISIKLCINQKWRNLSFVSITVIMILLNIAFAHQSVLIKGEAYTGETAELFAQKILEQSTYNDTCYTFDLYYLANIQLKYALNKRQLTVYQSQPGSPSSIAFNYNTSYKWLITPKNTANIKVDSLITTYNNVLDRTDATLWRRK